MKARTKEEIKVEQLSQKLRQLTRKQLTWAINNSFEKEAWATKNTLSCMECGHSWKRSDMKKTRCRCPHCHTYLNIKETNKRTEYNYRAYFGIITTFQNYQVFRLFLAQRDYKKGEEARFKCNEAVQNWINEKGKIFHIARPRHSFSIYYDDWNFNAPLELKSDSNLYYEFTTNVYPEIKYTDGLFRNGFKDLGISPIWVAKAVLSDPRMETLIKMGYDEIFKYFCDTTHKLSDYWSSLRICFRRKYNLNRFSLWRDYIDNLRELNKDLRNPKFVCPDNLRKEHNRILTIIQKKRDRAYQERMRRMEIQRKEEEAKRLAWEKDAESLYRKGKGKYLSLVFSDGDLVAKPLQSVQEYFEEGNAMHHCVFTNRYYEKENSLVFSATQNGERVETVEVSLQNGDVIQCYGKYDTFTPMHQQVLKMMKDNKEILLQRIHMRDISLKNLNIS